MDKKQPTSFYVEKILNDIEFIIKQCEGVSLEEFENNELLNNAMSFIIMNTGFLFNENR